MAPPPQSVHWLSHWRHPCMGNIMSSGLPTYPRHYEFRAHRVAQVTPWPVGCLQQGQGHFTDSTTVRLTSSLAHSQLGAILIHCPPPENATETNITKGLAAGILCPLSSPLFLLRWLNPRGLVLITGVCINILIFSETQKEDIFQIQTSVFCSRTYFLSRLKSKFHTSSVSFLGFHRVSRQDSNRSSKSFLCHLLASPWLPKAFPTLLLLPFHAQLQLFGSPPHSPVTHWGTLPVVPCSG